MTRRWFPLGLSISMAVLHIGLLAWDYRILANTEKYPSIDGFVRQDLERPLFEPYAFCGGWSHYSGWHSASMGLNLPAYVAAILLHSAINGSEACADTLMTPRGQIVVTLFVLPIWYLAGTSIRRLAQHRWRPAVTGRVSSAFAALGLLLFPLGVFLLLIGLLVLGASEGSLSLRAVGMALWMFYFSALAAERGRFWPFRSALDTLAGTTAPSSDRTRRC